jgi:hypothetical protein
VAATRGPAGVGSELDEALVRAGRHPRRGVVSADMRTLEKPGGREADRFYRDRPPPGWRASRAPARPARTDSGDLRPYSRASSPARLKVT